MELALGPRIAKSPFFDATVAAGLTHMSVYNQMYMPVLYGDQEAEYRRVTEGVSIWDVACQRQVELYGPDAAALAQTLCARDLSKQQIGQGKYAPVCDHEGRILNDPVVLKVEEDRWWLSIADGDVLVSIQSNPTLMPLLRHAGAIVTDDGGVACHAGIICRELKIPTIIGTGRATSAIHDGDLVEVDAIDQVVRILERAG